MTHPATAAATIPVSRVESRQARLDAAIALFRSEASASGYVVEEVRLRLPVPDVDVMPRVVIAQQSASSGAPPTFPRSKHHRPLASYPPPHSGPQDRSSIPVRDASYKNSTSGSYGVPSKPCTDQNGTTKSPARGSGFKRTVSGSVIFHSVPARTAPSQRENGHPGQQSLNGSQQMGPLSSIPYLPTKDGRPIPRPNGQHHGQFWKTVIGGERGKQIIQAAESMQRLRHADTERHNRQLHNDEKSTPMEISEPSKSSSESDKKGAEQNKLKSPKAEVQNSEEKNSDGESTHHINGHDIPESHVQLLLSSAADISAREQRTTMKSSDVGARVLPPVGEKKIRPLANVDGKVSGNKTTPTLTGKNFSSRSRRDGSERRSSGSSAARPYKCTKCPSSFDREGHLRVHILAVHEKKRPFVCQMCDASFGHSSSLLRHVRTVHQASPAVGSGKTNYSSRNTPNSNDSGTTKSELVCEDVQDDSEKHFRCSACGMAFNRVALLNRHVAEKHPQQTSLSDSESKTKKSP